MVDELKLESEIIMRLEDSTARDPDRESCIDTLEVLLSETALKSLLRITSNEAESYSLRYRAAQAIQTIGSSGIAFEITQLRLTASQELTVLLNIAAPTHAQ